MNQATDTGAKILYWHVGTARHFGFGIRNFCGSVPQSGEVILGFIAPEPVRRVPRIELFNPNRRMVAGVDHLPVQRQRALAELSV
jgi:hypothetical protein